MVFWSNKSEPGGYDELHEEMDDEVEVLDRDPVIPKKKGNCREIELGTFEQSLSDIDLDTSPHRVLLKDTE